MMHGGEWILRYPGTTYKFGLPAHPVELVEWELDADRIDVEDVRLPGADGLRMGRDTLEPGAVVLQVKIDFTSAPYPVEECSRLAIAARAQLSRAWRADPVRGGGVAELVMGGGQLVRGRPRRPVFDNRDENVGFITGELPFIPSHLGAYLVDTNGVSERFASVGIVAPVSTSGWVFPLVFPIQNLEPTLKSTWFEVGGTSKTPCVVEIHGPIQAGAEVHVPGQFLIRTKRALAYDQVAIADGRPESPSLTVNGSGNNFLAPSSHRLSELLLSPGNRQVSLRGISPEGTAKAVIRWFDKKESV